MQMILFYFIYPNRFSISESADSTFVPFQGKSNPRLEAEISQIKLWISL